MPFSSACPNCGAIPHVARDLPSNDLRCRRCGTVYRLGIHNADRWPAVVRGHCARRGDDDFPSSPRDRQESGSTSLVVVLAGVALFALLVVCAGGAGIAYWLWPANPVQQVAANKAPVPMPMPMPPGGNDLPAGPPGAGGPPNKAPASAGPPKANVSVGIAAPEIEAEDLDGKQFKLSDYRGKVVLLDFWGHW